LCNEFPSWGESDEDPATPVNGTMDNSATSVPGFQVQGNPDWIVHFFGVGDDTYTLNVKSGSSSDQSKNLTVNSSFC
jgi:hypothetical protein